MLKRAPERSSRRAVMALVIVVSLGAAACSNPTGAPAAIESLQELPESTITLRIVDEAGLPLQAASVRIGERGYAATAEGTIPFIVDQPVLAMATAPDHITMPIVITPDMEPSQTVRLLSRLALDGTPRVVLHFAGDTMMARRYQEPTREGTPVVTTNDAAAAAAVVEDVAPLFAAADVSSVNLETVIGTLPSTAAYPGKRFLLQSPPAILSALEALGADVATLGNNHLNDWQEAGVASTLRYLDEAGIVAPGAGATDAEAREVGHIEVFGVDIAYLSYTTVTGDYVNDSLPEAGEPRPGDVASDDAWQWEERPFGYGTPADPLPLTIGSYRAGDVWAWFRAAERELDDAQAGAAWAAAIEIYPELQDWVARRAHGGAAWFRSSSVDSDVSAARAAGADLVVVQLHGGFQFAEVPSDFLTNAARTSIDAGADLVVGHHPHVLQGFEWYRDKLIAYSLGNFVFDQDFLSTFSSVVLRTVFEGDELVEARLFPVTLDDYRPVPLAGEAADRLLRMLDVRSSGRQQSVRLPDRTIGAVLVEPGGDDVQHAAVVLEHGSGRVTVPGAPAEASFVTGADGIADLAATTTLLAEAGAGIWFGRDLFGYGDFEDVLADGESLGGTHWDLDPTSETATLVSEPSVTTGNWHVRMVTRDTFTRDVVIRPIARVAPADHRFVDAEGRGLDGPADHSVRLSVRRTGVTSPFIRVDAYHFFDADPTEDPESTLLRQMQVTIDIPADGNWHRVDVTIPAAAFADADGMSINAALIYLGVPPPVKGATEVEVDDIAVLEWRAVSQLPAGTWHEVDAVRTSEPGTTVAVTTR